MFHLNRYTTDAPVAQGDVGMPQIDAAGTSDSSSPARPVKLPRRDGSEFGGASMFERRLQPASLARQVTPSDSDAQAQTGSHTRSVTACERCRSRKTKCDNARPSCGHCAKIGVSCLYESGPSSSCHIVGPQILEAIGNLTALIQRQPLEKSCCGRCYQQGQEAFSPNTTTSLESAQSPLAQIIQRHNQNGQPAMSDVITHLGPNNKSDEQLLVKRQRPIQAQGLESVLNWKIFPAHVNFPNLFGEAKWTLAASYHLPNFEYAELNRLESKYITWVHVYNPVLDLPSLQKNMLHISENGLDWSTRTCLVALVCAIGAISGNYKEVLQSSPNYSASLNVSKDRVSKSGESEVELAMQYWGVAAKRLGYVVGQDDLEAVQCLCLAGIWHMHMLQPLQAWKYFSLAGNAWYAATLKGLPFPMQGTTCNQANSLSLEQSLYFTIYKSDCELRIELDLPGSSLEDIELSQTFPLPPTLDGGLSDKQSEVTERGWYYYLAEIAARHLINRMLRRRSWNHSIVSSDEIWRMLAEVKLFETQVEDWHSALPPMLKFEIPDGPSLQPEPDELKQILRQRYLTNRELIYRPFVRLCVEHELDSLEPHLRTEVAKLASNGLQYSMYKICQQFPQRHQGTWFMIRVYGTQSLILCAASKAKENPNLAGAASMLMPRGWRQQILQTMQDIAPCWNDGPGGVIEIKRVVEWALTSDTQ